ncbi:MAG TPA: hypothetical protein VNG33_13615, partial [Polyangiaceae bacterium]|nr:hypothetical protein [Polyangiaceae bacterium]
SGPVGLPLEAFTRLYAVDSNGEPRQMRRLADILSLTPQVVSEQQAYQLLRLETAADKHFLFPESDSLDVRVVSKLERPGDITDAVARRSGYLGPAMTTSEDGFYLRRDLIRVAGSSIALVRRTEQLSRSAQHRIVTQSEVAELAPADVLLPDYE